MLQQLIADAKAMEVEAVHGEKAAQEDYEVGSIELGSNKHLSAPMP